MKIAILDLNKQLSSERQKNATLEEQLARVNSGMERFKKDNQDESSLIEETYKVKIDSLKDQVVNLKHELGNAESSKLQALRQLSQTENMMEKTVADLEAQLRQSKLAFQELEFQLTKNKTSLKASFLSEQAYDKENQPSGINQSSGLQDKELIKKIDTYESTLAQYESEINHNKKSIAKVESLAKEESHKNVTLQHELDRKRARLSKLEDLQEELKLQLSKKEDLCTLQSAEISDLQIKLSSLESQLN